MRNKRPAGKKKWKVGEVDQNRGAGENTESTGRAHSFLLEGEAPAHSIKGPGGGVRDIGLPGTVAHGKGGRDPERREFADWSGNMCRKSSDLRRKGAALFGLFPRTGDEPEAAVDFCRASTGPEASD